MEKGARRKEEWEVKGRKEELMGEGDKMNKELWMKMGSGKDEEKEGREGEGRVRRDREKIKKRSVGEAREREGI